MKSKDGKQSITLYVVKARKSRSTFATVVPRKGVSDTDEFVNFMIDCIAELGYKSSLVYLNNDQEPAIKAVIDGVIAACGSVQTLLEESPVGASQSNGDAEGAVRTAEVGVRRLRKAIENRYNVTILVEHDIVPWLVRHAGFVHNRFQVGHDGKTPHTRVRGKDFDEAICEFGEIVYYKITINDSLALT